MDFPVNHGGKFWDIGVGLNVMASIGRLVGNSLSVEWLEPIQDDVNGCQLERSSTFALTWNYSFF